MRPLDNIIKDYLNENITKIAKELDGVDIISIVSLILPGVDAVVRDAIEISKTSEERVAVILQTDGGVVEVVESIVNVIRTFYKEVVVIVPDQAMSAGTVLALGADRIMMDYFSKLGPIDPQIVKDGKLVPALSYLKQYEKLNEKSRKSAITTAEYAMLQQLDVGELYQFEQARELSVELLIKWLSQYKFKDWRITESSKVKVTEKIKQERAREIAKLLNDPERWHSHGRGINIATLREELKLRIEDYSENQKLANYIKKYFNLLMDYVSREQKSIFVHTEKYFT